MFGGYSLHLLIALEQRAQPKSSRRMSRERAKIQLGPSAANFESISIENRLLRAKVGSVRLTRFTKRASLDDAGYCCFFQSNMATELFFL